MNLIEWIKSVASPQKRKTVEAPKPPQVQNPTFEPAPISLENGDCSCIHCHKEFWHEDFLGLCTSRECSDSEAEQMSIQEGNFYSTTGPRRILLRAETLETVSSMKEHPVEAKIATKSHLCPACNSRFYFYACPHCRHPMPRLKKIELKHTIAPAGIGSSGKSIYMTVLINKLLEEPILKKNLKVISNFFEKNDFDRFKEKYAQLYLDKAVLGSTSRGEIPNPYLMATTTRRQGQDEDLKAFMLWYDFPGEDLESGSGMEAVIQYFTAIGGIFFIVDPTNSKEVVNTLGVEPNDPTGVPDEKRDQGVLTQIGMVVRSHSGKSGYEAFQSKHIAVIVSKVDIFRDTNFEYFREDSVIWQPSPHQTAGEFSLDDFEQVNQEVEEYLEKCHAGIYSNIQLFHNGKESIKDSNIGYFAVSALGQNPAYSEENGKKAKKLEKDILPIRVEDPFYWMLWKMGHLSASIERRETDIPPPPPAPDDDSSFGGGGLFS